MDSLLRVVLRDELISWFKNKDDNISNQQMPNIEKFVLYLFVNVLICLIFKVYYKRNNVSLLC